MKYKKICEACGCNPCDCGWGNYAGVTQLVEYLVANQIVVGSSPITRLNLIWRKYEYFK